MQQVIVNVTKVAEADKFARVLVVNKSHTSHPLLDKHTSGIHLLGQLVQREPVEHPPLMKTRSMNVCSGCNPSMCAVMVEQYSLFLELSHTLCWKDA